MAAEKLGSIDPQQCRSSVAEAHDGAIVTDRNARRDPCAGSARAAMGGGLVPTNHGNLIRARLSRSRSPGV